MKIQEFTDMEKFEEIMENWAKATGLATVAVDNDGKYISKQYNFTDFCVKYTRGSQEGRKRCEECDKESKGVYQCHAGLIDFSIDLVFGDEKLGAVIGGQVLPEHPDEEKFRKVAKEIGVNEDQYINALKEVNVRTEEEIKAAAELLGESLNNCIANGYNQTYNVNVKERLSEDIEKCEKLVMQIHSNVEKLNGIQGKQTILALNASIEAARAGEAGRGFEIVARQVGQLGKECKELNGNISENVNAISKIVGEMLSMKLD